MIPLPAIGIFLLFGLLSIVRPALWSGENVAVHLGLCGSVTTASLELPMNLNTTDCLFKVTPEQLFQS
jgi:hypothetical protein